MDDVNRRTGSASRTRSIAFVGLSIALMAVSAWVSIPLGPVPFTLQTFVMVFALLVLKPKECIAAIAGYLVLGAVGLPLFSSMRGGIGVLAGPTGGFLWGFLLGAIVASVFLQVACPVRGGVRKTRTSDLQDSRGPGRPSAAGNSKVRGIVIDLVAALILLVIAYVCGWLQLMAVAGLGPVAAFATAVAPFLLIEVIKLVAAVATARAVRVAVR